jgi:protein-tyrosine phosphatase
MVKVLFVFHGNICRSPMAECLFKDMVKKNNLLDNFYIESCATSSEEIGNPIHYGTKRILNSLGIDSSKKRARRITKEDYDKFDYIILMDEENRWGLKYIIPSDPKNKIHTLLS